MVVDDVDNCYRALGRVHALYKPRPYQVRDYIAVPKSNGYQSIHTSMIGHKGLPIEVQIRTEEMDQMAELGVAAFWQYNDEQIHATSVQQKAQKWLQSIIELQQSAGNAEEFIESVKSELFSNDIYVFTPKGRIVELPAKSTAIDFAYAVHSDIGDHCVGAIVDRQPYPISQPLQSGQTIEILTETGRYPSSSWLNFAVSAKARSKIKQALKQLNALDEALETEEPENLNVELVLEIKDQPGVLASLTNTIASLNSNIGSVQSYPIENGNYQVKLQVSVTDNAHLYVVIQRLTKLSGVVKVDKK